MLRLPQREHALSPEDAEEKQIILTEKPVSMAIDEILSGKYIIIEPEEIRNI